MQACKPVWKLSHPVCRVLRCVCVLWDYFNCSWIFVYPEAQCLQAALQNDLELIALFFICVNAVWVTMWECKRGYLTVRVCLCAFTHTLWQWPLLAPGAERLTSASSLRFTDWKEVGCPISTSVLRARWSLCLWRLRWHSDCFFYHHHFFKTQNDVILDQH